MAQNGRGTARLPRVAPPGFPQDGNETQRDRYKTLGSRAAWLSYAFFAVKSFSAAARTKSL